MSTLMQAALACASREQAQALVASEVERMQAMAHYRSDAELRSIVKANIGFHSADYSRDIAARLLDLFECEHPFFGRIEDWPAAEEVSMRMGFDRGMAARRRNQHGLVSTGVENRTL